MNDQQIRSWILLATAIASENEPSDFAGISMIADGINHAIPTHKEMQSSLSYLIEKGLVEKIGNKYWLTNIGKSLVNEASSDQPGYWKIWKKLEELI